MEIYRDAFILGKIVLQYLYIAREDLSMKKNLKKIVTVTAVAGTLAATVAALITKCVRHSKSKGTTDHSENTSESSDDELDSIDLSKINNDTPREYVSISINKRIDKSTNTSEPSK